MPDQIECRYRSQVGDAPVCRVVSDFLDRPLGECHVNDSACAFCLQSGVPPQTPNTVIASMAIGVASRTNDATFVRETLQRFRPYLQTIPLPVTTCVLRGAEVREVPCKPCQADSQVAVMKAVYACPLHMECTLHNTGVHPRIHACATCADRKES